jgi:hypothetical protein
MGFCAVDFSFVDAATSCVFYLFYSVCTYSSSSFILVCFVFLIVYIFIFIFHSRVFYLFLLAYSYFTLAAQINARYDEWQDEIQSLLDEVEQKSGLSLLHAVLYY